MILLAELLRRYWVDAGVAIAVASLLVCISYQKRELADDAAKLATAAKLHEQDQQRIADLGKELADQNNAVTALQAQQVAKQADLTTAIAKVQTQQQKVVTLLAPTDNKKPSSREQAMPDVRAIIKGLQE